MNQGLNRPLLILASEQYEVFTGHFLNFYCLFIGGQKVYEACVDNDMLTKDA